MSTEMVSPMANGGGREPALSMGVRAALFAVALTAVTLAACQKDATPDPFIGPSELGLSLTLSASPDVLPLDGASQSLVTILARDGAGQVIANITVRLQIRFGGVLQDIGQLSARTLVTGADGAAIATYTAPLGGDVDSGAVVEIVVTPVGDNFGNAVGRTLLIRLVPPGIVIPPASFTAGFSFTPSSPAEFQDVLFGTACPAGSTTNCVNDPGGQVVSYAWDFGDGTTGSGSTPTHVYDAPSTYTVTLTVTDPYNRSATATRQLTVFSGGAPSASFTISPTNPNLGETVFFNASASSAPAERTIVSYAWEFGDGATASGVNVSHEFDVAASYNVTLTVTDSRGAVGSFTRSVTVTTSQPVASFIFSPNAPAVNASVFFDASASRATVAGRTLVAYDWVFGDGSTGSGKTTSHSYAFASTFNFTLTVTVRVGDKGVANGSITVGGTGAIPVSSFTVSPSPTTVGVNTVTDASGSTPAPGETIVRYDWDFGETSARFQCPGDASCGDQNRTFAYQYQNAGTYTINLTVTDSSTQTATSAETIIVNAGTDPTASFIFSPTSPGTTTVVQFNAGASSASSGRTIAGYTWNFGDGTTGTGATTTHTFATAGVYNVELTVTDSTGATGTSVSQVTVSAASGGAPTAPLVPV